MSFNIFIEHSLDPFYDKVKRLNNIALLEHVRHSYRVASDTRYSCEVYVRITHFYLPPDPSKRAPHSSMARP